MKKTVSSEITGAQNISSMCLMCGADNPFGLHSHFYNLENSEVLCAFTARPEHQSYPGRVHGGIISAILDETIGRACNIASDETTWGVTMELTVKYRKPVPYGVPLHCIARVDKIGSRTFEGTGEIVDEKGAVLAQGKAIYAKAPTSEISQDNMSGTDWYPDRDEYPRRVEIG
jgi:uncharacterized protein (TIGR00369 family)